MKAKKKEIKELELSSLVSGAPKIQLLKMESPPGRKAGVRVEDVASLMNKLRNEAKVL